MRMKGRRQRISNWCKLFQITTNDSEWVETDLSLGTTIQSLIKKNVKGGQYLDNTPKTWRFDIGKLKCFTKKNAFQKSGQITIIPKPECFGDFGGIPLLNHQFTEKCLFSHFCIRRTSRLENLGKGNRCSGGNNQA